MQITTEATRHLVELRKRRGLDAGHSVRIVRDSGRLGLQFAATPERGDRVVKTPEIDIYLAPDVADQMDGSVVDARDIDGKVNLVARQKSAGDASRSN